MEVALNILFRKTFNLYYSPYYLGIVFSNVMANSGCLLFSIKASVKQTNKLYDICFYYSPNKNLEVVHKWFLRSLLIIGSQGIKL